MPTVFSKNSQLNLNPIINLQNIISLDRISDYRLYKLGNGEKVSMLKLVVVINVKSFVLDLCRLILYIVLLLTDILNALIKNSPK